LYVGNDTGKDFVGPNVLGWTTVCLIDDGRNIRKQDFKLDTIALPKVKIQSIGELLQLI
jgi:putative hydrolase of the HAD superfamily